MKRFGFTLAFLFLAHVVSAQVVTVPSAAVFSHPDADYNATLTYHIDYFQCASVTPTGVCNGRATTPFQLGSDVPKTQVTGTATARMINLKAIPASGLISSMPVGVAFVATITAIADPAIPGNANSVASNTSNAFFAQARTLAAPSALVVQH